MALRPDRQYVLGSIDHFIFTAGERGGIVSYNGSASGVAMDSAVNTVSYAANPSGVFPAGVQMQDVVDKNLTQTHLNFFKDEVQVGGKVFVLKQGEVTTDFIYPGHNPAPGATAYLAHSGLFATSSVNAGAVVGRFVTAKDADGYAKILVNLP